jgi:capsular exopolysaccharide synthesis family protein
MNEPQDRSGEPLPARRAPVAPIAQAYDAYDDAAFEAGQGVAKKATFRILSRALRRHWWQALSLWLIFSAGLTTLAYFKIKPTFDASSMVRIVVNDQQLFAQSHSASFDLSQFILTQVDIVTSPPVLEAALIEHPELTTYPLLANAADKEADLRSALNVVQKGKTTLIQVSMSSTVPKESADFVNAVVGAFLETARKTYSASTEQMITQLKEMHKSQDGLVKSRRADVAALQKSLGEGTVEALKSRKDISVDSYKRLSEALTEAEIRMIVAKTKLDKLKAEEELPVQVLGEQELTDRMTELFYEDRDVEAIQGELGRVQASLDKATRLTRSPSDPSVQQYTKRLVELTDRKNKLWVRKQPALRRRAASRQADEGDRQTVKQAELEYTAASALVESLRQNHDNLKVQNKEAEGDSLKLQWAWQDLERVNRVFDTIQSNLEQREHEAKSPVVRVELQSPAKPSLKPNNSKRFGMMAAAPLGVGLLVMGLLVLMELRGARVNDPDELASRIRVQVIGVVPPLPQIRTGSITPNSNSNSNGSGNGHGNSVMALAGNDTRAQRELDEFVQSLDHLRVTLCARPDPWGRDRHCVLITSACGSEGKTTLAAQLAERCVNAGLMTLLIDGDLRNPTLSRMLEAAENPGLINVLRGDAAPEDVVIVVGDASGFHLLPAGTPRMDPSRLLQGDRLGRLLAQARESFDMIIVDAPPVLPVPDALTIGRWTDVAVLAVRYDMSRFPLVERANRKLAHVGVPVIGAVVNGIRSGGSAYGGYYAYGGYGSYGSTDDASAQSSVVDG